MSKKRLTVYELAEVCGVSIATVSRVINGHESVRPELRERVLARMQELGYHPSHAARSLSTGQSRVVSVWIGNLDSRYVMAFLGQLEQHLSKADYEMLLRNLWHRPPDNPLLPVKADGIIVLDEVGWVQKLTCNNATSSIPVVSMGARWATWTDHVGLDLTDGVIESIDHFLAGGARSVGYIAPKARNIPEDVRYRTYLAHTREVGVSPEIVETPWISNRPKVEEALEGYLASHRCPDALLCYNDDHALAVCRTLRRHGIRIPEDVAVIGCGGYMETEYLEHPLSTIVLPILEACESAWELLENRMKDPDLPLQSVILKPHLEIRASSKRS